jgi:hypothetical protein
MTVSCSSSAANLGPEDVFEVRLKDGMHGIVIDVTVAWSGKHSLRLYRS